jgi:pyruvate,water dikinase
VAGAILVTARASPEDIDRIVASAGTVSVGGAVLSHASLLAREFGRPAVFLGPTSRVRLVPANPEGALLALEDVVGGESTCELFEGDIAIIDGDHGCLEVPGGADSRTRRAVGDVHGALLALAAGHEDHSRMQRVLTLARSGGPAAVVFLVDAVGWLRLVPEGAGASGLLDALVRDSAVREAAERRMDVLRRRILSRTEARRSQALAVARTSVDFWELERTFSGFVAASLDARAALRDLGADADFEGAVGEVRTAVDSRREDLAERLRSDLAEAVGLPQDLLRLRLGGLHQLARRARAARLDETSISALESRLAREIEDRRSRAGHQLVVRLDDENPTPRALVGGKALGLMSLRRVLPRDCTIPRGFVVTTSAYRRHMLGEAEEKIRGALAENLDVAALSRRARAAILAVQIPPEVASAVAIARDELGCARLAVRSSATVEDGPDAGFAGLFDTYLGVRGIDELLQRLRWAWASMWNALALRAFAASGAAPLAESHAVLVQEMVPTRAAGVLFTRDPAGLPDTILVNATWGLGETIGQGETTGDLYWVRRSTGEAVATETDAAVHRVELDPERPGTVVVPLAPDQVGRPCLSESDLARLAELSRALELATGRGQDVEFGFTHDGALVLFQSRRIRGRIDRRERAAAP